jgi:hypothetical protein
MARTTTRIRSMAEKPICEASRALRLAAVLVFLGGMHPSIGFGVETGRPEIAAETARVILLARAQPNLSRLRRSSGLRGSSGARSRWRNLEKAPRVHPELTPDEQRRSGIWTREEIDAWRENHEAEGESSTRSEAGTRPDSNAADVTRSPIGPAPALTETGVAASQEWLRSPPNVLWLVWLPWLLILAALLSAIYILIRIIRVWATDSGRHAPPATDAISRPMQVPKA